MLQKCHPHPVWFGNPLIIMFIIVITIVILLSKLMNEINEDKGDEGIYENEDDGQLWGENSLL